MYVRVCVRVCAHVFVCRVACREAKVGHLSSSSRTLEAAFVNPCFFCAHVFVCRVACREAEVGHFSSSSRTPEAAFVNHVFPLCACVCVQGGVQRGRGGTPQQQQQDTGSCLCESRFSFVHMCLCAGWRAERQRWGTSAAAGYWKLPL